MELTALANRWKSDKGTTFGEAHKYTYVYDLLFQPYRRSRITLLELGLAIGGPELGGDKDRQADSPSVRMWLEYFTDAFVVGFDISDFSHIRHPRFTFIRGDLGEERDLRRLADAAPVFDIIIDDASHASYHQQLAFKTLFPRLAYSGLYIIEDLHWQAPSFESRLLPVPKTGEFFSAFFERFDYRANALLSEAEMRRVRKDVGSFAVFPSFNASECREKMIVIRKKESPLD